MHHSGGTCGALIIDRYRFEYLDELGTEVQVLCPSLWTAPITTDPAEEAAICRSYNRWMADFVSENPDRLFGVGVTPLQSVDYAVAEIAACAEAGLSGVTFRPERYNGLELFSEEMDRVPFI